MLRKTITAAVAALALFAVAPTGAQADFPTHSKWQGTFVLSCDEARASVQRQFGYGYIGSRCDYVADSTRKNVLTANWLHRVKKYCTGWFVASRCLFGHYNIHIDRYRR